MVYTSSRLHIIKLHLHKRLVKALYSEKNGNSLPWLVEPLLDFFNPSCMIVWLFGPELCNVTKLRCVIPFDGLKSNILERV